MLLRAIATAMFILTAPLKAWSAVIVFNNTFYNAGSLNGSNLFFQVPKFDTSLGRLDAISLTIDSAYQLEMEWEMPLTMVGHSVGLAAYNGPGGFALAIGLVGGLGQDVTDYIAGDFYAGDAGHFLGPIHTFPAVTVYSSWWEDLEILSGSGYATGYIDDLVVNYHEALCTFDCGLAKPSAVSWHNVTVRYYYGVPEPSGWALLIAGFAAGGVALRMSAKRKSIAVH